MNNPKNKGKKVLIIAGLSLVFLVLMDVLLIVVQVPYTADVISTEREPYTDEECGGVQLKGLIKYESPTDVCLNQICDSSESICAEKNFWGNCIRYYDSCTHYACTKYRKDCKVSIKNIDNTGGTWYLDEYTISEGKPKFIGNGNVFVNPTETGIITWSDTYDAGVYISCSYDNVETPSKKVCENVINYRDIPKTTTEVRYCNAWKKIVGWC